MPSSETPITVSNVSYKLPTQGPNPSEGTSYDDIEEILRDGESVTYSAVQIKENEPLEHGVNPLYIELTVPLSELTASNAGTVVSPIPTIPKSEGK